MNHMVDGIDIGGLLRARNKFEEFRQLLDTEQNKAGAIQAFGVCYELSWKIMKRFSEAGGGQPYSLKEIFRDAARSDLISDPTIWFHFISIRNITVHTYNDKAVEQVVAIFEDFAGALNELLTNLSQRNDQP